MSIDKMCLSARRPADTCRVDWDNPRSWWREFAAICTVMRSTLLLPVALHDQQGDTRGIPRACVYKSQFASPCSPRRQSRTSIRLSEEEFFRRGKRREELARLDCQWTSGGGWQGGKEREGGELLPVDSASHPLG